MSLLKQGSLSKKNAELILIVMRDNVTRIEQRLGVFGSDFPNLAPKLLRTLRSDDRQGSRCACCAGGRGRRRAGWKVPALLVWYDAEGLAARYRGSSRSRPHALPPRDRDRYRVHQILCIPDRRYNVPEMRETLLIEGRPNWLAWASAVGLRNLDEQARNYLPDHFANGSETNRPPRERASTYGERQSGLERPVKGICRRKPAKPQHPKSRPLRRDWLPSR